jgi:tetratricopeptide (TPR) repeat protein
MDQWAAARASSYRGGLAEAYYAQGATFFLKGYYREAWYGFARASVLKPTNAVYLHNLATVLQEIGSTQDARVILEWVTRNYPNLDPPWGSLGVACISLKDAACARAALARARALAPENGLYDYATGRLLESEGKKGEAQTYYRNAWTKGYSGSGNEGGKTAGGTQ